MKKINVIMAVFVLMLMFGCNNQDSLIKKDLDTRFTKFEIVEIRKDSSNINTAINRIMTLKIVTASTNLEISKLLSDIDINKIKKEDFKKYIHIVSLFEGLENSLKEFEKSRFDKVDPCYYVKYLIHKDENKITKEEYYFVNEKNGYVIHRSCDWNKFLYEQKYDVLIKDVLNYHSEVFDLRQKFYKK